MQNSAAVRGESNSENSNGYGVWGSGGGRGVYGQSSFGIGVYGGSTTGTGVQGFSTTATAVLGQTNAVAPNTYAVRGFLGGGTPGNGSAGVRGEANVNNDNTVGVWGHHPGSGAGVFGQSTSGIGVSGTSGTGSFAAGVYGHSTGPATTGVKANNSTTTGTALEIQQGALRVAGAGSNTTTAAFVVTPAGGSSVHFINNPMCNGDPNAILIVTMVGDGAGSAPSVTYEVFYQAASQQMGHLATGSAGLTRGDSVQRPRHQALKSIGPLGARKGAGWDGVSIESFQAIESHRRNGTALELPGETMLLVREVMYAKPGKVRPLVDKFLAMSKLMEKAGMGKMRVMTDFSGERYWTLVSEMEVPSLRAFEEMFQGQGQSEQDTKEFETIMKGYHDLVDHGRREIYKIEG